MGCAHCSSIGRTLPSTSYEECKRTPALTATQTSRTSCSVSSTIPAYQRCRTCQRWRNPSRRCWLCTSIRARPHCAYSPPSPHLAHRKMSPCRRCVSSAFFRRMQIPLRYSTPGPPTHRVSRTSHHNNAEPGWPRCCRCLRSLSVPENITCHVIARVARYVIVSLYDVSANCRDECGL